MYDTFFMHYFYYDLHVYVCACMCVRVCVCARVCVCVCFVMSTHCTITRFGFRVRRIDGVESGLFLIHAPLGQTTLRVGRLSVLCTGGSWVYGDCMFNCLCSVIVLWSVGWWWKEGKRWNPMPAHSLLFLKSTKGAAKLNVPIRRMNHYQQYYMPSQHIYCGKVWNLIQVSDVGLQSSD